MLPHLESTCVPTWNYTCIGALQQHSYIQQTSKQLMPFLCITRIYLSAFNSWQVLRPFSVGAWLITSSDIICTYPVHTYIHICIHRHDFKQKYLYGHKQFYEHLKNDSVIDFVRRFERLMWVRGNL